MGYYAGFNNDFGFSNVALGAFAGHGVFGPTSNGFWGYSLGNNNVMIGDSAGFKQQNTNGNVLIGSKSGAANETGIQNTFLGYQTGFNTKASANTFIGFQAGRSNTSGAFNTFMGVNAGISNTSGSSNFIMGTNAGSSNTTGTANFFLGDNAGGSNSTGGYNVFLGTNAGVGNTVGANNTAIGFEANVGSGGLVNATAIGFRAVAAIDNSVVLGNGANVGIGTTAPTSKLHVVSGTGGQSGLRLENLTSGNSASVTNQTKFLTVDGAGNVILGSTSSSTRRAAAEDLWELKGDQLQTVSGEGVVIGKGVSRTPVGYKLFVEDGILTEKVKVAVKNTSEWSDHVFASGYQLQPLAEVERYIKTNQHLPGVPSAQQMVEQGNDLHQTDARLLEKIEETMLYVLQLKREVDQLRRQNQQLQRTVRQLKRR